MKKKEKIVLAFSGGLDTSIILKWLQNDQNYEVVTFTADIGQGGEIKEAKEKVYSPKKSKNNKKNIIPTKPSKRVGRAGEEHVYNFEYKKIFDCPNGQL